MVLPACLVLLLGFLRLPVAAARAPATPFPCPPSLRDAVRFWIDVYTKYETNEYVLHDDEKMGVVLDMVRVGSTRDGVPDFYPTARQQKKVRKARDRQEALLRELGRPNTDFRRLRGEKRRLFALYGKSTNHRVYRRASERVRIQRGHKSRFLEGLRVSGKDRDEMARIFRKQGLPEELALLPHVESSFNLRAYSAAGAAGIWQFVRSTGRLYLTISYDTNERMDPLLATEAAAKLLKSNFRRLGSWPLAITAYNHGMEGVLRAQRALGTSDIGRIVSGYRSRWFGFASRNFYCEFLAAVQVVKNAEAYFGTVRYDPPCRFYEVKLPYYVKMNTLADYLGLEIEQLRELNPALRDPVYEGSRYVPRGYRLRIPPHVEPKALLAAIPSSEVFAAQKGSIWYKVRKGDSLGRIARRHGTTVPKLMALNDLRRPRKLHAGEVIRLPERTAEQSVLRVDETQRDRATGTGSGKRVGAASETPNASTLSETQDLADSVFSIPVADASVEEAKPAGMTKPLGAHSASARQQEGAGQASSNHPASGYIRVEPDETLGHYADWLKVPLGRVRAWNRLPPNASVKSGKQVKLYFEKVSPEEFDAARLEYRRGIEEDFFLNYKVERTFPHLLQKGESVWHLCNEVYNLPYWLLKTYNEELDLHGVKPGDVIRIPEVTEIEKAS